VENAFGEAGVVYASLQRPAGTWRRTFCCAGCCWLPGAPHQTGRRKRPGARKIAVVLVLPITKTGYIYGFFHISQYREI
jgi:hypothetical protein